EVGRDFAPHGGSPSGEVAGEVVFAGHGGTGTYGSRDDWAGVDVHGKIVLVLDGPSDGGRVTRLEKLIAAKWRGAAALLLVGDTLPSLDATAAGPGALVFWPFGGEALGLLGSGHYVRQPAVALAQSVAMLNFDMVGRLRDDRLIVQGADSGGGLVEVLEAAARGGVTLDVRGS